jgi:hypothetical protein
MADYIAVGKFKSHQRLALGFELIPKDLLHFFGLSLCSKMNQWNQKM